VLTEICIATGLVIAIGAMMAYWRSKDALHPAVVMAAPFGYFYCLWPILLNREGGLSQFLSDDRLEYCAMIFLAAIAAMFLGLNHKTKLAASTRGVQSLDNVAAFLPRLVRRKIFVVACVLGTLALLAYGSTFNYSPDFFTRLYSSHKGGGSVASGYIGEAVNLSLPAILFLAVAIRARGRLTATGLWPHAGHLD
jgi:hypothetical protein